MLGPGGSLSAGSSRPVLVRWAFVPNRAVVQPPRMASLSEVTGLGRQTWGGYRQQPPNRLGVLVPRSAGGHTC